MKQDQTQKKNMSIDDITREQWDTIRDKEIGRSPDPKFTVEWLDEEENVPNEHPVFKETFDVHHAEFKFDVDPTAVKKDMVNSPSHYTQGNIECIDAMQAMLSEEEFIGYLRGNSFKYRWRMREKRQAVQDLRKAQWYEERLKDIFEKMGTPNAV